MTTPTNLLAKSIYIKSFGCSHNMSDGEYMGGILKQGGYNITNEKESANLWYITFYRKLNNRIINTCTVRDKSISSFENLYKEAKKRNIPVVIAGCMTEGIHFLGLSF
jgi:threonylcarbamoyladenosine tRNA methylthiotransferase CDKAL1